MTLSEGIRLARLVERVHDFAVDVELELLCGRVSHAYRRCALVAGQPVDLPLVDPAFSREAVHDLRLRGAAGDRALEPALPVAGFLEIVRVDEREQRERARADSITVVPVANAAEPSGSEVSPRRRATGGSR